MAFEAYLQQGNVGPSRARRLTTVISVVVHAAAVLVAVAYSFWHVEEVVPPAVTVTFMAASAAPVPPPPPPPLGGGAAAAKPRRVVRPKVEAAVTPTETLAPKREPIEAPKLTTQDPPKSAPAEDTKAAIQSPGAGSGPGPGQAVGVAGGDAKGVRDGVLNGTGVAPAPASIKMLPPAIGAQQKSSGADPEFPPSLRTAGANYLVMAKICVASSGTVDSVTLLKRANPTLDNNVVVAVKNWRFKPLTANGVAVPFCYFGRFEFRSE